MHIYFYVRQWQQDEYMTSNMNFKKKLRVSTAAAISFPDYDVIWRAS
jgi:hypothetical protein